MKESWLEKLIELFRDYVENYWNDTKDPTIDNVVIYDWQWFYFGARFYSDEKVLSKKFWFIKRLVENDKIDFDNRDLKDRFMNEFERYPQFQNNTTNREFNINGLLMLLSISDTPIDDLISYLR